MPQMKRAIQKRRISPYLFICLCLIFALLHVPGYVVSEEKETNGNPTWTDNMNQNVMNWMDHIQQKDSRFTDWENATFEFQALGPGSRQWLVIITNNGEDVGYLIVGLNEHEDFVLIEYGKGIEEIFGLKTLNRDRVSQHQYEEAELIYSGLFIGQVYDQVLHDLITGEAYEHVPIDKIQPFWIGYPVSDLLTVEESKALDAAPIVYYGEQFPEASTFTSDKSYIYIAGILPQVTALYKVVGWHVWDLQEQEKQGHELYIGLEDDFGIKNEHIRFLSYSYLSQLGTFQSIE